MVFKMTKSTTDYLVRPRIGVVGLAFPGYQLGEELSSGKFREMLNHLSSLPVEVIVGSKIVTDNSTSGEIGNEFNRAEVDGILAVITTFVPDHFLVGLLDKCNAPVFLWCLERELKCLSTVCGPMITATLHELGKHYFLAASDLDEPETSEDFLVFARVGAMRRILRDLRVGYAGGKNDIMFSMTADDYTLKQAFGTTTITIPMEEFYQESERVADQQALECWQVLRGKVGCCTATDRDGVLSAKYYLAARALCEKHGLDALSINCFPHLKSKICLAVARLNDDGIASACEGDLYSTVLMHLFARLTGQAAFNGDFLRMYPDANEILFSHCGAGAFSLATKKDDIKLQASIETCDGLAVCYPTRASGTMTLANLMGARNTFRLSSVSGQSVATSTEYEGTPIRVRFSRPVKEILRSIAAGGAGHHWNGAFGDFSRELKMLCEWKGIQFNMLSDDRQE